MAMLHDRPEWMAMVHDNSPSFVSFINMFHIGGEFMGYVLLVDRWGTISLVDPGGAEFSCIARAFEY